MGWSWRRSISLGPLRLNFSKCGVGMSLYSSWDTIPNSEKLSMVPLELPVKRVGERSEP